MQTIRQLTATEATYLPQVLKAAHHLTPIVQYRAKFEPHAGHYLIASHVLDLRDSNGEAIVDGMLATYVDNWIRLKLVEVNYGTHLTTPTAYDWEETRPERAQAQVKVESLRTTELAQDMKARNLTEMNFDMQRGVMVTTALGAHFAEAVGLQGATAP